MFDTDGVIEASSGREEYGTARLRAQVEAHARCPAAGIGERILDDLDRFLGDAAAATT